MGTSISHNTEMGISTDEPSKSVRDMDVRFVLLRSRSFHVVSDRRLLERGTLDGIRSDRYMAWSCARVNANVIQITD